MKKMNQLTKKNNTAFLIGIFFSLSLHIIAFAFIVFYFQKKNNTALLIGISVSLALLIIALAVIVFYFQKKNKNLMKQVKHVSFQQYPSLSSDPDLLLSKQNE